MKTLILYATKNGATYEIARQLSEKISNSVVCNIKCNDIPSLSNFDCIIIGSSLYAGMIRKEAKEFVTKNTDILKGKKIGLFLSGLDASKEKEYFDANFSQDILQAATVQSFLGGIFDPKKAGIMGRLMMKMVAKQTKYTDSISSDKISRFVEVMKAK